MVAGRMFIVAMHETVRRRYKAILLQFFVHNLVAFYRRWVSVVAIFMIAEG